MFGYLLAVPLNADPSCMIDQSAELMYETTEKKYIKTNRMHELDREVGDIKMEIIDIETTAMLRYAQIKC